jgi:uncharacterized protein YodC (DUF2158 family)
MAQAAGRLLGWGSMARQFKAGEIVQLKSGGPRMTVDTADDKSIWATWFAGAKRSHARFSNDSIEQAPAEPAEK